MRRKRMAESLASRALSLVILVIILALMPFLSCSREKEGQNRQRTEAVSPSLEPRFTFEGKIIFQSDMDGDNEIYLLSGSGLTQLTVNDWQDEFPRVSPDGKWVAFSANRYGNYDLFVMALDGSKTKRLTASPQDEGELAWFPDGQKVAYTEERKRVIGRSYTLWSVILSTGQRERLLADFAGSCALPDFSNRASLLTFTGKKTVGWDIYLADLTKNIVSNLSDNGQTCRSRFSPDGRWIAYVSHEADHKGDIFLIQPDGRGKARLTERPETFDYFPSWSPDGRFVIFCSNAKSMYAAEGDWDIYVVDIATKQVQLLFAGPGRDVFPEWVK